jgi:phosphoserine phosphatase RsbU/P
MPDGARVTVTASYLGNLKKKGQALKILTEISPVLSSTLDLNELMTIVMEKAKNIMKAEACSILLYNSDTEKLEFEVALCESDCATDILKRKITLDMGQGIAGWVAKNRKLLVIKDVKSDKRFFHDADKLTGFVTKSLIAAPLVGRRGLIGVAEIINPRKREIDLGILQILTRHFAIAIENAQYHKDSVEKERLKQELEIAASLQNSFLPESPDFRRGNISVSAVNIPAKQIGGDLYDFIEPVAGKAGVFIGDVSGKGVSAALYMAKVISDFRYNALMTESPEIVMNRLNAILSRAPRGMFLTAAYMIIDTVTGETRLSVAGHPPFLWISGHGIKVSSFTLGPPLGIVSDLYTSDCLSLQSGDRLLLLTDGVFEAKNRSGQRMGFGNFVNFVEKHAGDQRLAKVVADYVTKFSRGTDPADDMTVVEIKFL